MTLFGLFQQSPSLLTRSVPRASGFVLTAPFEGTRWRPYGDSTDSQKSRLGLVVGTTMLGRKQWHRKPDLNGGVESVGIGEKR